MEIYIEDPDLGTLVIDPVHRHHTLELFLSRDWIRAS